MNKRQVWFIIKLNSGTRVLFIIQPTNNFTMEKKLLTGPEIGLHHEWGYYLVKVSYFSNVHYKTTTLPYFGVDRNFAIQFTNQLT